MRSLLSYAGKSPKSKSPMKSLASSKRKETIRKAEIKKILAEQAEESAKYEAEMEMRKIDIEMAKQREVRKLKFEAQIAKKEAEFMSGSYDSEDSDRSYDKRYGRISKCELTTPLSKREQTANWLMRDSKPTIQEHQISPDELKCNDENKEEKCDVDPTEVHPRPGKGVKEPSPSTPEGNNDKGVKDHHAVMLKINMLQAMQPIKFYGNSADFPNFRNRLKDNLEDGLLTDSQKIDFLPKFVSGEAYEVVERASGCSYKDVVVVLEERYGHPAAVAAACMEKLITGPKLAANDVKGLQNFAEQLEATSKKLTGEYESEASTISNLKIIVSRLPAYMITKWGDALYAIREKRQCPKLKDLAKFVKRQAAIKRDPGFVTSLPMTNVDSRPSKGKAQFNHYRGSAPTQPTKQTAAFVTDVRPRRSETGAENAMRNATTRDRCPCCSRPHDLSSCAEFAKKDVQNRWPIVKENKLCHMCLRRGHHRAQCRSNEFCRCGSENRHHKLLHNPWNQRTSTAYSKAEKEKTELSQSSREAVPKKDQVSEQRKTTQYATTVELATKTILLHVVPVKIVTPEGKSLTTYGLLDNGSRVTVISAEVAGKLGLRGRPQTVSVSTLLQQKEEEFEMVDFKLQPVAEEGDEKTEIAVKDGLISHRFNINEKYLPESLDRSKHSHLADIEIPEVDFPRVSVLIGKDVEEAHEVLEVRKPVKTTSTLQGLRGPLGWVITGTIYSKGPKKGVSVNFTDVENKAMQEQIEKFWKIDGYGSTRNRNQKLCSFPVGSLHLICC